MKALVLAAGLGTRLRPLTLNRAKPSLPVLGIPTLWYGAWHLQRSLAIEEFAMNAGHAPATVFEAGDDEVLRRFTGIRFHYSDESNGILGSSGALWKLRDWIGTETLVVLNADSICFPDWKALLKLHRDSGARLTIHARAFSGSDEPYTDLALESSGRVTGFGAKKSSGVMFAGGYVIEPALLERLPPGASELRPTLLEPLTGEGGLYAYREDCAWFDTGSPAAYARAQFELLGAVPAARALVETKMREEKPGCWVPKNWHAGAAPELNAPVVLAGARTAWAASGATFGPRFVGLEPSSDRSDPTRDAIVCSDYVHRL